MGNGFVPIIRVQSEELQYFPNKNPSNTRQKKRDVEKNGSTQIKVYLQLVKFLIKDPQIKINLEDKHLEINKDALAFFVEATKQLNQDDWENKIADVIEKIQMIRNSNNPEESHKKTTWLLSDLISNLYQSSLAMNMIDPSIGEKNREFLKRSFTRWSNNKDLRKQIESENEKVSIGGINIRYLPLWYLNKFIEE